MGPGYVIDLDYVYKGGAELIREMMRLSDLQKRKQLEQKGEAELKELEDTIQGFYLYLEMGRAKVYEDLC